jgi:hypothetical protein
MVFVSCVRRLVLPVGHRRRDAERALVLGSRWTDSGLSQSIAKAGFLLPFEPTNHFQHWNITYA